MAQCTEIRSKLRRPCLLRAKPESDVDAPEGKRAPPTARETFPFSDATGGSRAPDPRSLTIDSAARMSPRCTGLHRRGYDAQPGFEKPTKMDQIRTLQALSINTSDVDLIMKLKPRDQSIERARTKAEELQGVPLSGRGANIELMGGRRVNTFLPTRQAREGTEREAKFELNEVSVDHQFHRRHFSAPPSQSCGRCDDSEHTIRAEGYASLIGRPEGTGKRGKRPTSARIRPAFRCDPRNKEFAFAPRITEELESFDKHVSAEFLVPLAGDSSVIAQLREATRNTPSEEVWDKMLTVLSDSPKDGPQLSAVDMPPLELPSNAKVAEVLAATAGANGSPRRANRTAAPQKASDSPRRSPGRVNPRAGMGRNPSDASLMSVSTNAETENGSKGPVGSPGTLSVSNASRTPADSADNSPKSSKMCAQRQQKTRRNCGRAAHWLREEQIKARRRAAWVA